jgi:hypothetical protein
VSAASTSASVTTPPVCPTTTGTGSAAADGNADRGRRLVRMRKTRERVRSFFMWVYLQSFVLPLDRGCGVWYYVGRKGDGFAAFVREYAFTEVTASRSR